MFNFIKYHWFGLIMSIMIALFFMQFFIVLIAPHHDIQKRGFVSCTETMAQEVESCTDKHFCILRAVTANAFCDSKVIIDGLSLWVKGEQPRPWNNYWFAPEYPQEEMDEGMAEYYQENPDILQQMNKLKQQNQELENLNNEEREPTGLGSDGSL